MYQTEGSVVRHHRAKLRSQIPLHLMILPGLLLVLIYNYGPMAGVLMAFQRFVPAKGILGSAWIGLDNFRYVVSMPDTWQILRNTIVIAFAKITTGLVVPIAVALLLNELGNRHFKRVMQTVIYLPHFLSWVILGGILVDFLSPSRGLANQVLIWLGAEPVFFLGDTRWFPLTVVVTNLWKEFGYATIVYIAALTNIDPGLYEAAEMDGAGHWRRTVHVTIPGMTSIIVLMSVLSLGNILNAGFDQIFNLYNPLVYDTGDIVDTFVYRIGLIDAQYGPATAVGLFKSAVSLVFITLSFYLARRFAGYRIF